MNSPNSSRPKTPLNGAAPDNDARAALALFEGASHEDEEAAHPPRSGALEVADDASIRDFYAQLVTLLTSEGNAPPAPPPASRGGLRFALKRRFLPALILSALTLWGLHHLLKPKEINWVATTLLLLPPRPAVGAADPFAPPEANYDSAAQIALIGSDAITERAFKRLSAKQRRAGWGTTEIFPPGVSVSPASADTNGSLVEISVASNDARASLELAHQVVEVYKQSTQERGSQNRAQNLQRTKARVAQLTAQLEAARRARSNLKVRSGVGDAVIAQNSAAANITQLQNSLDAARRAKESATTTDGTLAGLRAGLQTSQTALQSVLRDFFPDSDRARAAQADVNRAQIAITAREAALNSAADAQIRLLEGELRAARAQARSLPEVERAQSRLDDRISGLESALHNATDRQNQLTLAQGARVAAPDEPHSATVGSNASIQKARSWFVALLGALVVGLVSPLLLDRLDRGVRATPDPESAWNAPLLGALPISGSDTLFHPAPPNRVGAGTRTQNIEACYIAQNNILSLANQAGARSILFSSALSGEDKATGAANLAVAMAYGGRETLLIDADFAAPTQHDNFKLSLSPGYAQVLGDELPLSQAIRPTDIPKLYVLTTGQDAAHVSGLLTSRLGGAPHAKNMTLLKKYFDVIVVSGPTTTSLADAQLITHLADAVVLVAAESTARAQVQRALSMLRLSGAFLLGVVVSRVRRGEVKDWNTHLFHETGAK